MVVVKKNLHKETMTSDSYGGRLPAAFLFAFMLAIFVPSYAHASCGCIYDTCSTADCSAAETQLEGYHDDIEQNTQDEFDDDLEAFEEWIVDSFVETDVIDAMSRMTNQLSAVAAQHTHIIGAFMDADIQMDTHRLFQQLQAEAHKDYRPSDDFCYFGTNVRSMANSETKGKHNAIALNMHSLARQLGNADMNAAPSVEQDYRGRWDQFVNTYCDTKDNNWNTPSALPMTAPGYGQLSGLEYACDHDGAFTAASEPRGAAQPWRKNIDIDYHRLVEEPRTIEADFTDGGITEDEEDLMALSSNLFGSRVLTRSLSRQNIQSDNGKKLYMALRSVAAKRSVAQHSFDSIVGLKTSGTGGGLIPIGQTRQYLGAIVKELMPETMPDAEIYELMGEHPSYYSQLEIMSKKLYQNPDFYANLYDTPANVNRKHVAMKAIELMLDRAIYESQMRKEMAVSVLLSAKLKPGSRETNKNLIAASIDR